MPYTQAMQGFFAFSLRWLTLNMWIYLFFCLTAIFNEMKMQYLCEGNA